MTRSVEIARQRNLAIRRNVTASFELLVTALTTTCLSFPLQLVQIAFQAIEACFPHAAIRLDPVGRILEWASIEATRTPLRLATSSHQPRALEHFQMLRDGGHAHIERLGKLGHRRLARYEPAQDHPAGRIGQCAKDGAQLVQGSWFNHTVK